MKLFCVIFCMALITTACNVPKSGDKYYDDENGTIETYTKRDVTLYWLLAIGTTVWLIYTFKNTPTPDTTKREWGPHLEQDTAENREKWRAAGNKYGEKLFEFFRNRERVTKQQLKDYATSVARNHVNDLYRVWKDNNLVEWSDSSKSYFKLGRVLTHPSFKKTPHDLNFAEWLKNN